jgi:hypothetical protein
VNRPGAVPRDRPYWLPYASAVELLGIVDRSISRLEG